MWRIIYKNSILGNYKHIQTAKEVLHRARLNGLDGFIIKVR